MCACVWLSRLYLRIIECKFLLCVYMKIRAPRNKFEFVSWMYEMLRVVKVETDCPRKNLFISSYIHVCVCVCVCVCVVMILTIEQNIIIALRK